MIAALTGKKITSSLANAFPDDQVFILTVDGVNFTIHEPRMKDAGPKWYDHKFNSAGITHELAIDISQSRIMWINGPRPGEFSLNKLVITHLQQLYLTDLQ